MTSNETSSSRPRDDPTTRNVQGNPTSGRVRWRGAVNTEDVIALNSNLIKYGLFALKHNCFDRQKREKKSSSASNVPKTIIGSECINPLQAARAWCCLQLIACGKTEKVVNKLVEKIVGPENLQKVADDMQASVKETIPECLYMFYDHQCALPFEADVTDEINRRFHSHNGSPPFRTVGFITDHRGVGTTAKINEEIAISTCDTVKFAIPMERRPNSLTQVLMATGIDCTFYWKPSGAATLGTKSFRSHGQIKKLQFYDTVGCYLVKDSQADVIKLTSHREGFHLFLVKPKKEEEFENFLAKFNENAISKYLAERTSSAAVHISFPNFVIERSMCLAEACNSKKSPYEAKRLFDREKAELTKVITKAHDGYSFFVRLWENYHGVTFKIVTDVPRDMSVLWRDRSERMNKICKRPEQIRSRKPSVVAVENAGVKPAKRDSQMSQMSFWEREREEKATGGIKFNEDLLVTSRCEYAKEDRTYGMFWNKGGREEVTTDGASPAAQAQSTSAPSVSFDTPFIYFVTRKYGGQDIVFCMGTFTNLMFPFTESDFEPPASTAPAASV